MLCIKKAPACKRRELWLLVYHLLQHTAYAFLLTGESRQNLLDHSFSLKLGSDVQNTLLLPDSHHLRLAFNFCCVPTVFVIAIIANSINLPPGNVKIFHQFPNLLPLKYTCKYPIIIPATVVLYAKGIFMQLKNRFLYKLLAGLCACSMLLTPLTAHASHTQEEAEAIAQAAYNKTIESNTWENWPAGPAIYAESAIVMEANTGMILYAKDIEEKNYPASITKIVTALIALENCELDEEVTYSYNATHSIEYGSSSIARTEDEILTVEESLYALMLSSANECANALAEHIAGSTEKFAEIMNEKAKELGCVNTHFSNANGLHDENHYTCAYDMALLTRAAIANEDFRRISGTDYYTLRATNKNDEELWMQNHHHMIAPYKTSKYLDDTVFSGKTGYTSDALNTLVTCGTRNGMDVIVVTMRTQSGFEKGVPLYTDTAALLDYANNFQKLNISENEQTFVVGNAYDFSMESGEETTSGSLISIDDSSSIILPNNVSFSDAVPSISFEEENGESKAYLTYEYAGQKVGKASITLSETTENNFDFSKAELEESDLHGTKFITINVKIIFIAVFVILALLFLVFLIYRFYEKNHTKIRRNMDIHKRRRLVKRKRYRRHRRR